MTRPPARMYASMVYDARLGKPSLTLQGEIDQKKSLLAMRGEVLAALQDGMGDPQGKGAGFSEYLRGLGRQSVSGLWLTGFAVSAGGADMSLRGRALDNALLPDYVRRLKAALAGADVRFFKTGQLPERTDTSLRP